MRARWSERSVLAPGAVAVPMSGVILPWNGWWSRHAHDTPPPAAPELAAPGAPYDAGRDDDRRHGDGCYADGCHDGVRDDGVRDDGVHDGGVHDGGVHDGGVHDGGVHGDGSHDAGVRHIAGAPCPPPVPYDADIVILALDRAEETCAAIDSALAQQGLTRHVMVLDQGSCPAALDRLAMHVANRPDVTLLAGTRNLGVAGGRNLATARGHGRIVAALDNDAEFASPTTLARAVAVLDDNPALGIIGCRIVVYATGADDLSSWGYPARLQPRAAQTFDTATFVGAGHAIRRTAWNDAGGYDPALFFCWEEFDLARRAIAAGWRVQYRGDLVIRHKVSGERRVAWSEKRWFQHVRNRLYLGRKYGDTWLTLAPRIAGYLVKGARNGLLSQTLAAIAAAARMPHHPALLLTQVAQAYLHATDVAPRGGWIERLRREVLAEIPRAPDAPAGRQLRLKRSRTSKASTAGLSSR